LPGVSATAIAGALTVTDPGADVIAAPEPSRSASTGVAREIANTPAAEDERVTESVATIPLPIVFAFSPVSRQIFPWQYNVLPAAVADGPACAVNAALFGGREKVHCNPAVLPVPDVNEMGRLTVDPATPETFGKLRSEDDAAWELPNIIREMAPTSQYLE